jgi:putative transposase
MPRYIRHFLPGATYFFTVTLADRASTLLVDEIARLRMAYAATREQYPFDTVAICVLPDHLHAVWRLPVGDADVPLRWGSIKRAFSRECAATPARSASQARRREKGIWQRRYWEHQIRNEDDLARHVEYIHWNPVKHGLVRQVRDWPFSSFHQWVRRGDLPPAWGLVEAESGGRFGERAGFGAQAELAHPTGEGSSPTGGSVTTTAPSSRP